MIEIIFEVWRVLELKNNYHVLNHGACFWTGDFLNIIAYSSGNT